MPTFKDTKERPRTKVLIPAARYNVASRRLLDLIDRTFELAFSLEGS